jgi:hypothetical protein
VKKSTKKFEDHMRMMDLFLEIWNERPHKSEVSGEKLGKEPLTIFFHHIFPKKKFPERAFDKENIILLTWEEHDNVEINIYKYDKINYIREKLKQKYDM